MDADETSAAARTIGSTLGSSAPSIEELTRPVWPDGPISRAWRLRSQTVAVTVTELGAHMVDIDVFGPDGRPTRVTHDYPQPTPGGHHGATAGRWANRIAGSSFELDGVTHRLTPNEGPNQLHGGPVGFQLATWSTVRTETTDSAVEVELGLESPAGDQGYPGRLSATARFRLEGDTFTLTYSATTDAPTVVNLTSHPYWNLDGSTTLAEHSLTVRADQVAEVDDAEIPLPQPLTAVDGTRFDLRTGRRLDEVVAEGGYDNCYLVGSLDGTLDQLPPQPQVVLSAGNRRLEITTDQPGVQVYTGWHLDPVGRAVALETQRFPDAPNRPDLGPSILRPGERYRATTRHRFVFER